MISKIFSTYCCHAITTLRGIPARPWEPHALPKQVSYLPGAQTAHLAQNAILALRNAERTGGTANEAQFDSVGALRRRQLSGERALFHFLQHRPALFAAHADRFARHTPDYRRVTKQSSCLATGLQLNGVRNGPHA